MGVSAIGGEYVTSVGGSFGWMLHVSHNGRRVPWRAAPRRRRVTSVRVNRDDVARKSFRVARRSRKRRPAHCLSTSPGNGESENIDIDRLAEQLSNAARKRRSLFQSPFDERKEDFNAEDFEVVQTLGYLSVKVSKPQELPAEGDSSDAGSRPGNAAVVAFVARYFSGKPYQYPVLTLLREYLPEAKTIAENEFRALTQLTEIPEDKWEAATSTERCKAPVAQLLGYFRGSFADDAVREQSLWFVYKWEGMKPLSAYFTATQNAPGVIWPWAKSKEQELKARHKMIRSIFRGVMEAVTYCHENGIVHGSLGTGSVLLSTFDDHSSESLVVQLDNFGFATRVPVEQGDGDVGPETDYSIVAVQGDLRSVGILFFETAILAFQEGKGDPSAAAFVERLITGIFDRDFRGLREYCSNEPNWSQAVRFLNKREESGWELLESLLDGSTTSAASLRHKFLE